jgi:uncharacterized membrane protein
MKNALNIIGTISFIGIVAGIVFHIWMPGQTASRIIQTSITIFTADILIIIGQLASEDKKD